MIWAKYGFDHWNGEIRAIILVSLLDYVSVVVDELSTEKQGCEYDGLNGSKRTRADAKYPHSYQSSDTEICLLHRHANWQLVSSPRDIPTGSWCLLHNKTHRQVFQLQECCSGTTYSLLNLSSVTLKASLLKQNTHYTIRLIPTVEYTVRRSTTGRLDLNNFLKDRQKKLHHHLEVHL